MSCLDVMYQVYGPPQPYFAAAYTPYHQKLAYYSKMQEAQECNASPSNSSGSGSSFSSQTPASIKEEEGSPEKERPPEAEYINSRCVLFTYFQGDISSVVDEHFSRALSQPSSYSPSCTSSKAPRSSGPWRVSGFPQPGTRLQNPRKRRSSPRGSPVRHPDLAFPGRSPAREAPRVRPARRLSRPLPAPAVQFCGGGAASATVLLAVMRSFSVSSPPPRRPKDGSFPMSQRSFPASFWNSAYQTPVPAPLGSPLAAAHSELPFAAADPYSPAALHGHLHQGAAEPWHHAHPHHAHPHHPYALGGALGAQAAAYPRPAAVHEVYAPHFDPRYGPLLMPAASGRPARLAPASAPAPGSPPCELSAKGEPAGATWAAPGGPFASPTGDVAGGLGLSMDSGLQPQDKSKDLYWF
ncbi:hypothetical protein J1605_012262 [Eschrichtius robustus]|uniref:Transcription cofactor vestigial-like protein 2 n=1 Tax=Eschrichtius robustus TaxID=9764 RepID=A0AB34GMV7_ESCRO|nr:hypothetical protein J1605_012262 [Eschrichtius robustus]